MKGKKKIFISGLCILCFLSLFFYPLFIQNAAHAYIAAQSSKHRLENWSISAGGPFSGGNVFYDMARASFGLPLIGVVLSNPIIINEIPTFDRRIITGFQFINFFVFEGEDDQYDIKNLRGFTYPLGDEIQQAIWTNDQDPYFTWTHKAEDLPVDGYSVEFDAIPDKFVDTINPYYQTPDFYLSEGQHTFYVIAKNADGSLGNPGAFEIWVDITDPAITENLPEDSSIINNNQPTIQATLLDELSGIDPDLIDMTITTDEGTSQVLASYDPDTRIVSYTPVTPLAEGVVTISLSVLDKAGNTSIPLFWTFTIDTESPTGSLAINNDAPSTDSNIVTLNLDTIELGTELDMMIFSNDGVFDDEVWEAYQPQKVNWFLSPVAGIKTVYVKFKDVAGNESEVYSDSIVLTVSSPNTFITASPPSITQDTIATINFTSTQANSYFSFKLDNDEWSDMSQITEIELEDLELGNHYFQVRAGFDLDNNGTIEVDEIDATPAFVSWTIGSLNPSTLFSDRPVKYYRRD